MREAGSLSSRHSSPRPVALWHPDLDEDEVDNLAGEAEETARPALPDEQILTYEPVTPSPAGRSRLERWLPFGALAAALAALGLAAAALFFTLSRPAVPEGFAGDLARIDQQQIEITSLRAHLADLDDRQAAASRASVELTAQLGELDRQVKAGARKAITPRQEDAASIAAGHPTIQPGDQITVSTAGVTVYSEPNTGSQTVLRLNLNDRATVVGSFLSPAETRWYQIRVFGHPRYNTGWVAERELYP